MKKCPKCNITHNKYGSFCSRKCSNSRIQTEAIKKKIGIGVKNSIPRFKLKCVHCKKDMIAHSRSKRYCSTECKEIQHKIYTVSQRVKVKHSGGLREGGGHQIILSYFSPIAGNVRLNQDEIRVATIFDKLKIRWSRNKNGFKYLTLDNIERKYYPDFYLHDYDCYVEYKGWTINVMEHKMKDTKEKNNFKLLIIYSKKYANKDRLSLEEVEKNNALLIKNITIITAARCTGCTQVS